MKISLVYLSCLVATATVFGNSTSASAQFAYPPANSPYNYSADLTCPVSSGRIQIVLKDKFEGYTISYNTHNNNVLGIKVTGRSNEKFNYRLIVEQRYNGDPSHIGKIGFRTVPDGKGNKVRNCGAFRIYLDPIKSTSV